MADERAKKVIRLHYWGPTRDDEPYLTLLDTPGELRMGVGPKAFISVKKDQISLSGGTPSVISIQGMSSSMKYAGMLQDLPFPLTMIPSTTFTPLPKQIMVPPLLDMLETVRQVATIASSLVGV